MTQNDIPMKHVHFKGVRGKGLMTKLRAPLRLKHAYDEAKKAFMDVRPDVVLGLGGYVTVPGGLVARTLRVPLVLHEQNSVAGMSNRLLALPIAITTGPSETGSGGSNMQTSPRTGRVGAYMQASMTASGRGETAIACAPR